MTTQMNDDNKLQTIFKVQSKLQQDLGHAVGSENIIQWYNSLTAAVLEIGETLQEDTRWKLLINANRKAPHIDRDNVVEETADVFIYLVNACIFYNITADELLDTISCKQEKNIKRLLNV